MPGHEVLDESYRALVATLEDLDDETGWRATRCAGWAVRDLVHHLLTDAQRALVALHTPAAGPADVDAVSYWRSWRPGTPEADAGRRGTRIMASAYPSVVPIVAAYVETSTAVTHVARDRAGVELVATQGHVLCVESLLSTLAVEATIHHLDLNLGAPSAAGLAEARRVLDGLLGRVSPIDDDSRYALVATGRDPLTADERAALGADARLLPLLG